MKKVTTAFIALLFLAACNGGKTNTVESSETKSLKGVISIDGSSTLFPLSEALAEDFRTTHTDVQITVGESGTGGGFKKFSRGELDISNASRTIKASEDSACKANGIEYIELAICSDCMAIVVHPENTFASTITVSELKTMWEPEAQGKVKLWSDVNSAWPKEELHLFGAGTQSGTYDYFTEAINGKAKASRGDYTASEDDNVLVQGIARDKLALGYFGLAYYETNKDKLKLVAIDNGNGAVLPSITTVQDGTYQPLSRPLFMYINMKALSRPEVVMFIEYCLNNANKIAAEVGYVPLPDNMMALVKQKFVARKSGSAIMSKNTVGMKLVDIISAQ
ncbi:MAG: PstS family phosphate ABC transporter substrate-binding protein [Bacteroidetes bacterium]|nr:PstS family phosphate ABC transporter substrate-binding protein [Bacteroidota bacterium]